MAIRVSQKNWNDEEFRIATLTIAQLLGEEIEVEIPKIEFKSYNAQIWKNDDILFEKDFDSRKDALKWIKLKLLKESHAYADLKKYNKKHDDFDWWFYRVKDSKLVDVTDEGELV